MNIYIYIMFVNQRKYIYKLLIKQKHVGKGGGAVFLGACLVVWRFWCLRGKLTNMPHKIAQYTRLPHTHTHTHESMSQ